MEKGQKITVQESPWDGLVLDPRAWAVKNLKFKYLLNALKDRRGDLLEIGSGHGKILFSLHHYNKYLNLYGNELDQDAVDYCRENFQFTKIIPGGFEGIPTSRQYNVIVLYDILEHVESYESLLDKCSGLLAPGGELIAFVMCEGGWNIYSFLRLIKKDWSALTRGHIHYYSRKNITREISQRFTIVERKYLYHPCGSFFDAAIFFITLFPGLRKRFWANYQKKNRKKSVTSAITKVPEIIFYVESTLAQNVSFGACGVFLRAIK